jgi:nitrite reductase/ring-hydroxylating ferredoxin subunit
MLSRNYCHAPPAGTALCSLEAVPDGGCKELRYGSGDEAFRLLLYRRGKDVRAYINSCPHFALPLNANSDTFFLLENARIMCAWHCAVFRLEDGYCEEGPAQGLALDRVPVLLVESRIMLAEGSTHGP